MARTVYHMGHERQCGWVGTLDNVWANNYYDASYSRCAIVPPENHAASLTLGQVVEESSAEGYWFKFIYLCNAPVLGKNSITVKITGASYTSVELRNVGTNGSNQVYLRLFNLNSNSYVDSATVILSNFVGSVRQEFTIHVYTVNGSAKADLFHNSDLVASVTAAGSGNTGAKMITLYSCGYAYNWAGMSETILANFDIRSYRVKTLPPATAGTYQNQATGTVADIDEALLDSASVELPVIGGRFSVATAALGITGKAIAAMAIGVRGTAGIGRKMDGMVRLGGADVDLGSLVAGGAAASGQVIMQTNPVSGESWTEADLPVTEYGIVIAADA